jgi:hypothetical protein
MDSSMISINGVTSWCLSKKDESMGDGEGWGGRKRGRSKAKKGEANKGKVIKRLKQYELYSTEKDRRYIYIYINSSSINNNLKREKNRRAIRTTAHHPPPSMEEA